MKTIVYVFIIAITAVCTWLVADGDRARLAVWTQQWIAGNTLKYANATLQVDRMKAEADDLHHYIATLEDNLAYQMEVGRRMEREAASAKNVNQHECHDKSRSNPSHSRHRDFIAAHRVLHCFDNIANELNAVEAIRR